MFEDLNWLGLLAGCLTTISFLPQVIKVWKTRSTKDISLGMFSIFVTGVTLWSIYGVIKNDIPIIVANTTVFVLASIILGFKLKYK
jgi:MtN3 and saliva related transmembrane protein